MHLQLIPLLILTVLKYLILTLEPIPRLVVKSPLVILYQLLVFEIILVIKYTFVLFKKYTKNIEWYIKKYKRHII